MGERGGGGGDMKYLLKRLSSRQNFSCVFQVDDAMLMFDKTTNRHRGKCTASAPLSLHFFCSVFLKGEKIVILCPFPMR